MQTRKSPLRMLSVLLTVAVLFGVFACLPVGAVIAFTDGDYRYTIENGEATVFDYIGKGGNVTIPSTLGGYPVTKIGWGAFYDCTGLTSVVIPGSVKVIGNSAFYDCDGLTSVELLEGVTAIGDSAFYYCESLTSVVIPNGVTAIGDSAFNFCYKLKSVVIPNSVTSIGYRVFNDCPDLEHITVQAGNEYYEAVNDCLIEKATETLLRGCKNSVIPDGVKVIGDGAFDHCYGLTSVVIPEGVTKIGEGAFFICDSLTSVVIPNGVTEIGWGAFAFCQSLTSVVIPGSVTSIGYRVFNDCSNLEHITVQAGSEYYEAVNNCLIEKATDTLIQGCNDSVIPDGVKTIGEYAFSDCESLTSIIIIPDSVTEIGNNAFESCSALKSIFIPISVTTMGWGVFNYCDELTICCEAPSKPEGWHEEWTGWNGNVTVVWGCQPPEKPTTLGDPSGDGSVNANDYMMLKRYVLHTFNLTADQLAVADINADGDVNANDYMILKRAVLGTYKLPTA